MFILLYPSVTLMSDTNLCPYFSSLPPEHLMLSYCGVLQCTLHVLFSYLPSHAYHP